MFAKYMTTALLGSALVATAALAQTPSATEKPATPAATAPATPAPAASTDSAEVKTDGQWRASKVVGLKVYNDANESLGSVNELLMDKDGKIHAAVLSVGGFLGVGSHYVAVPYEKIKWVNEPVPYTGASGGTASSGAKSTGTTTGAAPAAAPAKPNPWYPDHGVFNATKDQLKSMPEFKFTT